MSKAIQKRPEPKEVSLKPQYRDRERLSLLFQDVYNSLSSKQGELEEWHRQLSDIIGTMEKRLSSLECFAKNVRKRWGATGDLVQMVCINCDNTFLVPKDEAEADSYIGLCLKCWSSAISPQDPEVCDDIGDERKYTKKEVVEQFADAQVNSTLCAQLNSPFHSHDIA